MKDQYLNPGPNKEEIDRLAGKYLLQFGTEWCGFCQSAEPLVEKALAKFNVVKRIKVEDGPGRKLGRSFRVKLWPTLIFLRDGVEVARIVRPSSVEQIEAELQKL